MTQITVVSVGDRMLSVVSARSTPGGVEIVRAATTPLPEGLAGKTPEERAAALRDALGKCGGGNGRTALVVPRAGAILRDFELPAGTPEEVLQMLRFQVEKELPLPIDQVRYSYVQTPGAPGKLHISVAAVPKEPTDALLAALEGAGCRIQSAYVSSFGLANLLPSDATLDGGTLIVSIVDGAAEVLVVENGAILLSRAAPLRDIDGLATEIDRTMRSYSAQSRAEAPAKAGGASGQIKRVLIAGEGDDADKAVAALRERLGQTVDRLVLNGSISRRADVKVGLDTAAAAGVCVGALRGKPAMPNVLRPPAIEKKFRLKPKHRIAILVGLIAASLLAWSRVALSDRRAELDALKADFRKLDPEAQQVLHTKQKTALARQWLDDRYPWIDMFNALHEKIDRSRIWLTSCTADDTGTMRLLGKATHNEHVSALIKELQTVPAFRKVEGEYTKPAGVGGGYKFDFSIKVQLAGLAPIKRK